MAATTGPAGRGGDARDLRRELARVGVVVRDEEKRQYWRLTRGGTASARSGHPYG
ncbi:hypothetical protein ACFY2R_01545 [Micromonospora olivasterospora]|uniref:Cysteinyl-tRNA ligase anticodon binding domain-containing protein n=1 Tax=Micromonospora olivasterospora TaxID=1880 RepID=A0A562IC78_MICOL|nr:hypothetical protein [Micromonospora olivasterospora]TWH68639.1 hypothetical protein JD77_03636 [Micromonospora olivasterospora]